MPDEYLSEIEKEIASIIATVVMRHGNTTDKEETRINELRSGCAHNLDPIHFMTDYGVCEECDAYIFTRDMLLFI